MYIVDILLILTILFLSNNSRTKPRLKTDERWRCRVKLPKLKVKVKWEEEE
jgi:hypothetical protein